MHAGGVPPQEEWLIRFLCVRHEAQCMCGDFLINRLHALFRQRAGAFDFLSTVWVRPRVNDATGTKSLSQFGVFEVVRMFRFILGVEVIKRAKELIKAVRRWQMRVEIA